MEGCGLQAELKKVRPFDSPEQEIYLNLARTADHLATEFAALFKAHGLSESQYNVLRILRGTAAAMPCQEIASRMVSHMPDLTRLVDRLEAAGLVERNRTKEDRRLVLIRITEAGLARLAALDAPVLELHGRQLSHLSADEMAELNRLLVKARRPD